MKLEILFQDVKGRGDFQVKGTAPPPPRHDAHAKGQLNRGTAGHRETRAVCHCSRCWIRGHEEVKSGMEEISKVCT